MKSNQVIEQLKFVDVDTIKNVDWAYYWARPWKFWSLWKHQDIQFTYWLQINNSKRFQLDNQEELDLAYNWAIENCFTDEEFWVMLKAVK